MKNELKQVPSADVLKEMHKTFLEALRQREQEIFSYLTTLGLAFGGFGWLLIQQTTKPAPDKLFMFGTSGVLLLLALGSWYALALGYNYRYLTFQLAKIESNLEIKSVMLNGWPRSADDFRKYTWYCLPPEIIKVFWFAFIVGIAFVTGYAGTLDCLRKSILIIGSALGVTSAAGPLYFGWRFRKLWKKESAWNEPSSDSISKGS